MLKAPQITYLDYKPNGENYDVSFAKVFHPFLKFVLHFTSSFFNRSLAGISQPCRPTLALVVGTNV